MEKELVSQIEYDKMQKRLDELNKKLVKVSKEKTEAAIADPGNTWHDNFGYEQRDLEQQAILKQINNLQKSLKNSKIIKPKENSTKVDVYDKLKLLFTYENGEKEELILELGGENEEETISLNSPLGKAIYNKKYNSKITYNANGQDIIVQILEKIND